jgi:hypothetical protein
MSARGAGGIRSAWSSRRSNAESGPSAWAKQYEFFSLQTASTQDPSEQPWIGPARVRHMVGESGRTVQYPRPELQALADLQRAFEAIGKVVEINKTTLSITGKARCGLQSVKLRVSVLSQGDDRSLIQIQGFGDDVWGGGARKGTDKLLRALESLS